MILLAALLIGQAHAPSPILQDPALNKLKTLVGGVWEGTVEKGTKVQFRFSLEDNGTMLVSNGLLGAGSKHPYPMRVSIGWDPAAKKAYYLDQHGNDTVYFGHVSLDSDGTTVWDFRGLSGDSGHYVSREKITANTYSSTMAEEQNGKWVDMGFHLALHRRS